MSKKEKPVKKNYAKEGRRHMLPRKTLCLVIALGLFATLLAGCFPNANPGTEQSSSQNVPSNTPANPNISQAETPSSAPAANVNLSLPMILTDGLTIIDTAKIHVPENAQWKMANAKLKTFSKETLNNATFVKERSIAIVNETESGYDSAYKAFGYEFTDGAYFFTDAGYLNFSTPFYRKKDYSVVIGDIGNAVKLGLDNDYKKESLNGLDKDAAVSLVRSAVASLGVSVADTEIVYALDYETIVSKWRPDSAGINTEPWEKGDEAYLVILTETLDGIPITNKGYVYAEFGGAYVEGGRIAGLVTKDGLINLDCNGLYEPTQAPEKTNIAVGLDEAILTLSSKYKDIIISDPISIIEITAEIVPICTSVNPYKYELTPCWVFTTVQTTSMRGEPFTTVSLIIINALTGKEIRINGVLQ